MLTIQNRTFYVPDQIVDLTGYQLQALRALQSQDINTIPKLQAFWVLLQCPENKKNNRWLAWFIFKNYLIKPILYKISLGTMAKTREQLPEHDLLNIIEVYSDKLNGPSQKLFVNPYPILKIKISRLFKIYFLGSINYLSDITFRQFRTTEKLLIQYANTPTQAKKIEIIANLYRRLPHWTDKFFPKKNVKEALQSLNPIVAEAVFRYYFDSRTILMQSCTSLFPSNTSKESITISSPGQVEEFYETLLNTLAESPINLNTIDTMPLWDVIKYSDKLIKTRKQQNQTT
jgi:hypothetical protein